MRLDRTNDESEQDPATQGDDPSANAADISEVLGGGDAEYVVPEERKSISQSTLVLILLVVLGGAGLYVMHLKTGPKSAVAAETQEATKTISTFLSGGETNIRNMENALRETEQVVQRFLNYPSATQIPLDELKTNPFRQSGPPSEDPNASDIASKRRREEERQAVIRAVQSLQLQSVMSGGGTAQRACMINNVMYREGQVVEGFTVERINANAVVVRQGAYRFELRMQR
jgi:hypothetical protein